MRRRRWKCAEGLLLLLLVQKAHAQACCVAPSTTGLGRLAPHESMLAGVEARGSAMYGTFAPDGRFDTNRPGTRDVALEQNVFASARFLRRAQGTVAVPFVETVRGSTGLSSAGGGVGDVRLSARVDVVYSDDAQPLPGVAVLAGGSIPTGTPPERATNALATDATGIGTTQGWVGFALEELQGPWLAVASGTVSIRADRTVDNGNGTTTTASLPPRFTVGLAGAHAWTSGFVVSLGATYALEDDASIDGERVPGSHRRSLQLTLALQAPLWSGSRLVVSTFGSPPVAGVTAGETATTGLAVALVVPWM